MSHFSLAVISREESDIDEILEPFFEGLEMEPYVSKTKRQLVKDARDYYNMIYNERFSKKEEVTENEKEELYNLKKIMNMTDSELYEHEKAKFDDEDFDREGNLLSTYNPKSKYDWYKIGGRWSGLLELKEKDNYGNPIKVDQARIKDINLEPSEEEYKQALKFWENYVEGKDPGSVGFILYKPEYYKSKYKTKEDYARAMACFKTMAIVTLDGEWHEKGEMLWFGILNNEEDEWDLRYKERFLDNIDENLMLTIIDCHI